MGASTMLSRVNKLVNVGYGEKLDGETRTKSDPRSGYTNNDLRSSFANSETWVKPNLRRSFANSRNTKQEYVCKEYVNQCNCDFANEEMGILNRKGGKFLTRLYGNNEEFREKIINFVRHKRELDLDLILDKRCKTNTLNSLGNKYLAECITSKDNTKDLIEIMAKYYPTA